MAAGVADHVWTLAEIDAVARFEPAFAPTGL
jgi:hypothetical protein